MIALKKEIEGIDITPNSQSYVSDTLQFSESYENHQLIESKPVYKRLDTISENREFGNELTT